MKRRNQARRRRGTVLLIVVSLLALLFVIITGFLTLSRNDRITLREMQRGDLTQRVIDAQREKILSAIERENKTEDGRVLAGPGAGFEQIPGLNKGAFIQADPINSQSVNLTPPNNSNDVLTDFVVPSVPGWTTEEWTQLKRFVYPHLTKLSAAIGDKPNPEEVWRLFIENDRDTGTIAGQIDARDIENAARDAFMDADGDGLPDSWFPFQINSIEEANAMAGTPVQLSGTNLIPSQIPPFSGGTNILGDAMHNAFVRYRELARFDVANLVKSNGGMITLDAARVRDIQGNLLAPWNRSHAVRMFDDFRSAFDRGAAFQTLANYQPDARNFIFDQLAGDSASVELSLRRRGGLPPAPLAAGRNPPHTVPGILAALQGEGGTTWRGFPSTFVPQFRMPPRNFSAKSDASNRFNLQAPFQPPVGNERLAAVMSKQISPTDFLIDKIQSNVGGNTMSLSSPARAFEPRGYITSVNNSDDIMRKMIPGDPIPMPTRFPANYADPQNQPQRIQFTPNDPTGYLGNNAATAAGLTGTTHEGELKFYLGEIAKGIVQETAGTYAGLYRWQRFAGNPGTGQKIGDAIIEKLARVYYDMLSQHDGWEGTTPSTEILSRHDQALHLAVNTAQFAMPRSPLNTGLAGFVDVVTYQDGVNGTTYIGYGPQPYISEIVATVKYDDVAQTHTRMDIGVELFNPCDPHFVNIPVGGDPALFQDTAGAYDVFALPADQFAVSLTPIPPSDSNFNNFGTKLGGRATGPFASAIKRLNGRCFYTLVFDVPVSGGTTPNGTLNNVMHNLLDAPKAIPQAIQLTDQFTVHLWKQGILENSGGVIGEQWYLIDKLTINLEPIDQPFPAFSKKYNWRSRSRDTSPNRYFGAFDFVQIPGFDDQQDVLGPDGLPDTFARWNVVMPPIDPDTGGTYADSAQAPTQTLGSARYFSAPTSASVKNPDLAAGGATGPTTPLVLMNAGPDPIATGLPLYSRFNNLPAFGSQRMPAGPDPQAGDLRPRSFPTVGFLHFVPRFAHWETAAGNRKAASDYLQDQWTKHDSGNGKYEVSGSGTSNLAGYPADLGHMPIFDNNQRAVRGGVFDDTVAGGLGKIPWGLLVYDYFTTLDPAAPGVDPLRIPGRTNINTAQWNVLAQLPVIGPALPVPPVGSRIVPNAGSYPLPIRRDWNGDPALPFVTNADPAPSFWDPTVGVLAGNGSFLDLDPVYANPGGPQPVRRLQMIDIYATPMTNEWDGVEYDRTNPTRWRLGNWLAISAAAYRDGIQNLAFANDLSTRRQFMRFADSYLRNPVDGALFREVNGGDLVVPVNDANTNLLLSWRYRDGWRYRDWTGPPMLKPVDRYSYGDIRGRASVYAASQPPGSVDFPRQFGFVTIGELLNVKGWDSSRPSLLPPYTVPPATPDDQPVLAQGDFVRAVSLMALLDTQVLTTRSNTFTAYVSVMDRERSEDSVRAQFTIDRSNLLPRLAYTYHRPPPNAPAGWRGPVDSVQATNVLDDAFTYGTNHAVGLSETPVRWTAPAGLRPTIVAEKRIGYFNTRFDD